MLKVAGNLMLAIPYTESFLRSLEERHLRGIIYTQAT